MLYFVYGRRLLVILVNMKCEKEIIYLFSFLCFPPICISKWKTQIDLTSCGFSCEGVGLSAWLTTLARVRSLGVTLSCVFIAALGEIYSQLGVSKPGCRNGNRLSRSRSRKGAGKGFPFLFLHISRMGREICGNGNENGISRSRRL